MSSTDIKEFNELLAAESARRLFSLPAAVASMKREENAPSDYVQWTKIGGMFFPAGETIPIIPKGAFRIVSTERGIAFYPFNYVTDALLELPDSKSEAVIAGIRHFWNSQEKFIKRGQIFKRGVLLWGPAGGGKSSTVALMSRDILKRGGIVVMSDSGPGVIAEGLAILRQIEPNRPVVTILEDIDEIIAQHGERTLLSLLDGEHQISNVCNIATTNFPERLGARFARRPSRFDEIVKIDMPNAASRRVYLMARTDTEELAGKEMERWIADTEGMSLASLRELIVGVFCLDRPYEEVLEKLKQMQFQIKGEAEFQLPSAPGFWRAGGAG